MNTLSKAEQQQYDRHLILDEMGEAGQLRLKQAKVLVVGAGGLGCPVLQYLAAAGVGTVAIIDGDVVDLSNLQRQILFTTLDVGRPKAEVAAEKLRAMNPHITCVAHVEFLSKDNALALFESCDIVVDASDNFATRYLVNDAAVLTHKPVVFGAISKFDGQVAVYNFNQGPTYRCLFPNPPLPNELDTCANAGVLGVLPGMIGVLQANEVMKIICGMGEVLSGKLLTFNALNLQQMILGFEKNEALTVTTLLEDYELFCRTGAKEKRLSWEEYAQDAQKYQLIDIREPWEIDRNPMGGVAIPLHELPEKWTTLSTDLDWVVYCESGVRSAQAIELLKELGAKRDLYQLEKALYVEEN